MCTAVTYKTRDFYFGRTLDYDQSFGEEVVLTPRHFPLEFRHTEPLMSHYALLGMAMVAKGVPLYYEAMNEKGLAMAGLNFVGNAVYHEVKEGCLNLAQFELIPWILGSCANLTEVRRELKRLNLVKTPFSDELPSAQLHWLVADRSGALTLEATQEGLQIYDNPIGVLTNNPPFPIQMFFLNQWMGLSNRSPENQWAPTLSFQPYSLGMGAIGLPGDLSSPSRFARIAFSKQNAVCEDSESSSVSQFFHLLATVEQPRGCSRLTNGSYEITLYTSCCNASKGIYYYTTYENRQITAVDMHRHDLDASSLYRFPLVLSQQIHFQDE